MSRIRERLTYANVTATLALMIALGGTAYAADVIGSKDIADDAVRSRDVKDASLRSVDLATGASGPLQEVYSTSQEWTSEGQIPGGECEQTFVSPPASVDVKPTDTLVVSADFLGAAYLQISPDVDADEDILFAYVCNNNPAVPLGVSATVNYRVLR